MARRTRVFEILAGEVDDMAVGFTDRLASGETLTGTPTVTVHDKDTTGAVYAGVTISDIAVNTAERTDEEGTAHAIGKAVEWRATAAEDATPGNYWIRVECATTVSGRSIADRFTLRVYGPPEA